ncbi:MAG: arylsulfotransferase family protein [Flavobacteriales bacterium]
MNRLPLLVAQTVLVLAALSAFGWVVKHRTKGDLDLGWGNVVVDQLAGFPDLFKKSVKEAQTLPQTYVPTPDGFDRINRLTEDVLALSAYSNEDEDRNIDLWNLRTGDVVHRWTLRRDVLDFKVHRRVHHPLLLEDKSVVSFITGREPLFRLDSASNMVWRQDSLLFHHAINLDAEGHIWACVQKFEKGGTWTAYRARYEMDGKTVHFLDNSIARIHPETGHIEYVKSCVDILKENGLEHLVLRSGDPMDPLHLNDVEPALFSGPFFEEGDVFLSFRNLQAVLQFRPSTGEVVRVIDGPLAAQHDVDVLGDSTLVIFNNATQENVGRYTHTAHKYPVSKEQALLKHWYSHVVEYDLASDTFRPLHEELVREHEIMTFSEGLQERLPDGSYFVEEQNSGVLWVLGDDGVLYKDVLASHHEGHHHLPNWTRIISSFP